MVVRIDLGGQQEQFSGLVQIDAEVAQQMALDGQSQGAVWLKVQRPIGDIDGATELSRCVVTAALDHIQDVPLGHPRPGCGHAGMPDGDSILGSLDKGQRVIIEDGVAKIPDKSSFAGSVATADRLVRTMINVAEVPLVDTIKMMTINPAKIMRINQIKGSLAIGKYADIVIFDKNISVLYTIIEGRIIHKK